MRALCQDRCKEDVRVELKALVEQCRTALKLAQHIYSSCNGP
jgi:hypothetical protein